MRRRFFILIFSENKKMVLWEQHFRGFCAGGAFVVSTGVIKYVLARRIYKRYYGRVDDYIDRSEIIEKSVRAGNIETKIDWISFFVPFALADYILKKPITFTGFLIGMGLAYSCGLDLKTVVVKKHDRYERYHLLQQIRCKPYFNDGFVIYDPPIPE